MAEKPTVDSPNDGWETVDTSDSSKTSPITPLSENMSKEKRTELRKGIIKPIIDRFILDVPNVDKDLNDDKKELDEYNHLIRNRFKEHVVHKLACQEDIPDKDLEPFIETTMETVSNLKLPQKSLESVLDCLIQTPDTVQRAKDYQQLTLGWGEKFMGENEKINEIRLYDLKNFLYRLSGTNTIPRSEPRSQDETAKIFNVFTEIFDYFYTHPQTDNTISVQRDSLNIALSSGDPAVGIRFLTLFKEIRGRDSEFIQKVVDIVYRYSSHHGLSDQAVGGIKDNLIPALDKQDPQIEALISGGNWAMNSGEFGLADYLVHCYVTQVTPLGINQLTMALREVPGNNLAKLEQNRLDAPAIDGSLRELVHDQRPYVPKLLEAMLNFYQTGERLPLEAAISKGRTYEKGSYENQFQNLETRWFDKSHFEQDVTETVSGTKHPTKAIDVLKRLVENTKPDSKQHPETDDSNLNKKLAALEQAQSSQRIPQEVLGDALNYVNSSLIKMMREGRVGLEPNFVQIIAWLERRTFESLQKMNYEDQVSAFKQKWFKDILLFHQLTSSATLFDQKEFDQFTEILQSFRSPLDAYRYIGGRTLRQLTDLAKHYKNQGKQDLGALWSGNVTHELVGLVDFRAAETVQGKKSREEAIRRQTESGYHPGD